MGGSVTTSDNVFMTSLRYSVRKLWAEQIEDASGNPLYNAGTTGLSTLSKGLRGGR
jgi:hypothetical protein